MGELEPPYELIVDELLSGTVVPFFGSAASAVYRPKDAHAWEPGDPFLPFGAELATILARASRYGAANEAFNAALAALTDAASKAAPGVLRDEVMAALRPVLLNHVGGSPGLALIASWVEVQNSRPVLQRKLHQAFDVEAKLGALHTRLAAISKIKLYVTTNYDDLLERALKPRRPNVLVDRGRMGLAIRANGTLEPVNPVGGDLQRILTDPQTGEQREPILFKMHGSIDRENDNNDSYLITERDYVEYLGRNQGDYIPPYINGLLQRKNFLFLGYSLEDWNVRVILSKLLEPRAQVQNEPMGPKLQEQDKQIDPSKAQVCCWAIVRGRSDAEQRVWQSQRLNIFPMNLQDFSDQLVAELDRRPGGRT